MGLEPKCVGVIVLYCVTLFQHKFGGVECNGGCHHCTLGILDFYSKACAFEIYNYNYNCRILSELQIVHIGVEMCRCASQVFRDCEHIEKCH